MRRETLSSLRREFAWEGLFLDQFHATHRPAACPRSRLRTHRAKTELRFDATVLVVASSLQIKRKQKSTKAGVHEAVTEVVNQVSPTITCHCAFSPSASDPCLQVADYMTWAIQRKYEGNDPRSYDLASHLVKSEFEPFRRSGTLLLRGLGRLAEAGASGPLSPA